jgi:hypothetical protein
MFQSIMKSPLNILSPRWSGFFILVGVEAALGISFGGSGAVLLAARVRLAKGFAAAEKEGERLVLSRSASDQLKPSPKQESVNVGRVWPSNKQRPGKMQPRGPDGRHIGAGVGLGEGYWVGNEDKPRLLPAVVAVVDEGLGVGSLYSLSSPRV